MKKSRSEHGRSRRARAIRIALVAGALAAAGASQAARESAGSEGKELEPLGRPGRPLLVEPREAPRPDAREGERGGAIPESLELCLARLREVDPFSADARRCAPAERPRSRQ